MPKGDFSHYDPDIAPGAEKWHEPREMPFGDKEEYTWPNFNDRIHAPDGTFRPAYVCHMRANIHYSKDKMWYINGFIRGMSVDQALRELRFINKKGARIGKKTFSSIKKGL